MKINPFHLKKNELQIYLSGHCKHRVPYQQHPDCFQKEILQDKKDLKIGIIDIEFVGFNIKADMGIILTYVIKEYQKNVIYQRKIKPHELKSKNLDKQLVKCLIRDMSKFDVLVTYYGSKCDLPYIRTRALRHGLQFIQYGFIKQIDLYYIIKNKFKLHKKSLNNACCVFGINGKILDDYNFISGETWLRAVSGHRASLDYILKHDRLDVFKTEKLYTKIIGYSRKTNRSI